MFEKIDNSLQKIYELMQELMQEIAEISGELLDDICEALTFHDEPLNLREVFFAAPLYRRSCSEKIWKINRACYRPSAKSSARKYQNNLMRRKI